MTTSVQQAIPISFEDADMGVACPQGSMRGALQIYDGVVHPPVVSQTCGAAFSCEATVSCDQGRALECVGCATVLTPSRNSEH